MQDLIGYSMYRAMCEQSRNEYKGYHLDVDRYELSEKELQILEHAYMLCDNGWTLRELSRNCGTSKSELSREFQKLRSISYELYQRVQKTYCRNIFRRK